MQTLPVHKLELTLVRTFPQCPLDHQSTGAAIEDHLFLLVSSLLHLVSTISTFLQIN